MTNKSVKDVATIAIALCAKVLDSNNMPDAANLIRKLAFEYEVELGSFNLDGVQEITLSAPVPKP